MRKGGGGYIEPLTPDGSSLEGGGRPAFSAFVSIAIYHGTTDAKHHPWLLRRIHLRGRWVNGDRVLSLEEHLSTTADRQLCERRQGILGLVTAMWHFVPFI